ncbi:hypothetical protein L209DRAFT_506995 [Thermothelomyces heterothallicus CBS 203.75]
MAGSLPYVSRLIESQLLKAKKILRTPFAFFLFFFFFFFLERNSALYLSQLQPTADRTAAVTSVKSRLCGKTTDRQGRSSTLV